MRCGHQGVDEAGVGIQGKRAAGADHKALGPEANARLAPDLGCHVLTGGMQAELDGVDVAKDDGAASDPLNHLLYLDPKVLFALLHRHRSDIALDHALQAGEYISADVVDGQKAQS